MYSDEIQRYLEERNYHLDSDEVYDKIINTSKQIVRVSSGERRDGMFSYHIYTDDGYNWIVWMDCKG